jgi:tetratricopeptide (TPR) repeat protein
MIVAESTAELLISLINEIPQLDAIYISCASKDQHEQWAKEWPKIKGVYTEMTHVSEALEIAVKQCNQDSAAISFINVGEGTSNQNLDQLEPSFMYTQIFKEILLEMEYDEQSVKDLVVFCRQQYIGNTRQINIIDEFARDYRTKSPIWWYTRECFTYQMLNQALRTMDGEIIIIMGFFIRELHYQIEQLHQQQLDSYHGQPFTVYRGQGLSETDFDKLLKTKRGLLSFNNFLSTSKKYEVSLTFAKKASAKTDTIGIFFKISINPTVSSASFAAIQEASYFKKEEEVLFSMHTVFRIGAINKIENTNCLYEVELTLTADDDQQLRTVTNHIREETEGSGWERVGALLLKIGQFNKAEELYKILLHQASDDAEKSLYYNQLGAIKIGQGHYEEATSFHEKSLEIAQKDLSSNHSDLAQYYNNLAVTYYSVGEYAKALSFYKKVLDICEKPLSGNHFLLATSYNKVGEVYQTIGEYSTALSFYEKALRVF